MTYNYYNNTSLNIKMDPFDIHDEKLPHEVYLSISSGVMNYCESKK